MRNMNLKLRSQAFSAATIQNATAVMVKRSGTSIIVLMAAL